MNHILILGAGQIGQAAKSILSRYSVSQSKPGQILADTFQTNKTDSTFASCKVSLWDKISDKADKNFDLTTSSVEDISKMMVDEKVTHVVNALPFFLNKKVAESSAKAGCHYIDFTEDDQMAEAVQAVYAPTGLTCAVKCGLAPGFINYVGHSLAKKITFPDRLMVSVGALPRTASFKEDDPGSNYNLSWSIDGLVNEYIRSCKVRMNGKELDIQALSGVETILIDGTKYEAAFTSGGIGSLVKELRHIPNVYYKTLRYPGHYSYVIDAVNRHRSDFDSIKKEFQTKFPFNSDDVIVVYAECIGRMRGGEYRKETFASKYRGYYGLSAIQSTTAGGGLAVLEMILKGQLSGMINHSTVPLEAFRNTEIYLSTYFPS